jgi:hypothetical protein
MSTTTVSLDTSPPSDTVEASLFSSKYDLSNTLERAEQGRISGWMRYDVTHTNKDLETATRNKISLQNIYISRDADPFLLVKSEQNIGIERCVEVESTPGAAMGLVPGTHFANGLLANIISRRMIFTTSSIAILQIPDANHLQAISQDKSIESAYLNGGRSSTSNLRVIRMTANITHKTPSNAHLPIMRHLLDVLVRDNPSILFAYSENVYKNRIGRLTPHRIEKELLAALDLDMAKVYQIGLLAFDTLSIP